MTTRLLFPALLLCVATLGCSSQDGGQAEGEQRLKVGIVFDSNGRGDKSFNDSAYAGVERAQQEFGIEARTVDSQSAKDYGPNIEAMVEQGCKLVFAVGADQAAALKEIAPRHPEVKFAIVDEAVEGPNVRSLKFREEEGSYLAGYLAALTSKTGKIGFVGGMEIPVIKKFLAGYRAGAKAARPDIQILPPKYTGSWDNVDVGKTAARVLFSSGADIVFHAAGRAGLGVLGAAKDAGKYAIGVDQDQDYIHPGFVLTSMIKRVDEAVYQTIRDTASDQFTPGERIYGLAEGGVGLSEMKHTRDKIDPAVLAKLEQEAERIKRGDLKVPVE